MKIERSTIGMIVGSVVFSICFGILVWDSRGEVKAQTLKEYKVVKILIQEYPESEMKKPAPSPITYLAYLDPDKLDSTGFPKILSYSCQTDSAAVVSIIRLKNLGIYPDRVVVYYPDGPDLQFQKASSSFNLDQPGEEILSLDIILNKASPFSKIKRYSIRVGKSTGAPTTKEHYSHTQKDLECHIVPYGQRID